MDKMKNYVFFIDLPLMEDKFYFYAEEAIMKKPLVAYQEIDEDKVLHVTKKQQDVLIKNYNKHSAQFILNDLKRYENYEAYEGKEDRLFYHYHNLFEVSIVTSGEGYYFVEGKAIKVSKGSIVAFNGLVPHAWIADEDNPPRQMSFNFYPTLLLGEELEKEENSYIKEYLSHSNYIHLHGEEAKKSFEIFESIYEEYNNKEQNYQLMIKQYILMFFIYNMRKEKSTYEKSKKRTSNLEIETAIKYMKNNFHLNITLEEVAKHVYMHPNYFSALFKKKSGISFVDYINILKIAMSTELMQSTDLTIQEIAYQCGFTSLSNFYRVFKAIHNISPAKYIKQI